MSKRQRTNTAPARRAKRPIDKKLWNAALTAIVGVQQEVNIYPAATFPGTITGLRWDIMVQRTVTNATFSAYSWAIVVVPAGTATSTLSLGNDTSLYDPEQNVLAFGRGNSWDPLQDGTMFSGSTKSMRKLKAGDKLVFAIIGTATHAHAVTGTVQFFYKT